MELRVHLATTIDLGACLGCGRCALACREEHAPARGAEHLWHVHVELRPGPGHPVGWASGARDLGLADFGEPLGYREAELFEAPPGDLRPAAAPRSRLTGELLARRPGPLAPGTLAPRDLAGRGACGAFFHLPRQCNHCLDPACVEGCRRGALRSSRADGAVAADPARCIGDGGCARACPYAKATLDLADGHSQKCDLCRARLDQGRAPACVEFCPARRFGLLLLDASRLAEARGAPASTLGPRQRALLLDPADPAVAEAAWAQGLSAETLDCALRSPVLPLILAGLALPLLPELGTLPMVFYVPPSLPAVGAGASGALQEISALFGEEARAAALKLAAIRAAGRAASVGDLDPAQLARRLEEAELDEPEALRLGALLRGCDLESRVVLPSARRGGSR